MKTPLIRVVDSRGIQLPEAVIEQAHLGNEVDVEVMDGVVMIRAAHDPRAGWAEAAAECHAAGDDCFEAWCPSASKCSNGAPATDPATLFSLRPATGTDTKLLAHIHRNSIESLCAPYYDPEAIEAWTALLRPSIYVSALRDKVLIVAEESGGVRALGILDLENGEVGAIYVDPAATGHGIGTAILQNFEKRATEARLSELRLKATLNARGFYKRHGYVERNKTCHVLPCGTQLPCIAMYKSLPVSVRE